MLLQIAPRNLMKPTFRTEGTRESLLIGKKSRMMAGREFLQHLMRAQRSIFNNSSEFFKASNMSVRKSKMAGGILNAGTEEGYQT